jgi:hypothetical protein
MNTLDKDQLDVLIASLMAARKAGFESLSSPVEPLLETAVDVCLLLASSFEEGKKKQAANPEIKFLDVPDSLGNPKSIKVFKNQEWYWNPQLAEIFRKLASFFSWCKRGSGKIEDVMSKISEFFGASPPIKTSEQEKKLQEEEKKRIKKNSYFYYRRRDKRKSISKYHHKGD